MQTKERSNTNKGKKEEGELDEKMKAEDKGKKEDVEEVSKAGESWSRNVIIEEEKVRGGERAEKGWCMTPVGKGRNRYGAGAGYVGRTTNRSARQTGTQASCTGDVVRQINGHLSAGRQHSARRLTHLRRNHKGLAAFALRVSDRRTGAPCNQTERNLIGQMVNLNSRGNWAGKKCITSLQDFSRAVYNYMQVV